MVYEHDARGATDARLAMDLGLFGARDGRGTAICDERGPGKGLSFCKLYDGRHLVCVSRLM